jgi:hypothetical protein
VAVYPDLPDVAPNRSLLEAFRAQGVPARGGRESSAGLWELHTHPDLELRLMELAGAQSVHTVYGLSCVAEGRRERAVAAAVAVAVGMGILVLRLPAPPSGLRMEVEVDGLSADNDWHCVSAWQSGREAEARLARYVRGAMSYARDLAALEEES